MVKFMQSIGDTMLGLLEVEAKKRDVTIQKLVRAIIIPEWIDRRMKSRTLSYRFPLPVSTVSSGPRAKRSRSSPSSAAGQPGLADDSWT